MDILKSSQIPLETLNLKDEITTINININISATRDTRGVNMKPYILKLKEKNEVWGLASKLVPFLVILD